MLVNTQTQGKTNNKMENLKHTKGEWIFEYNKILNNKAILVKDLFNENKGNLKYKVICELSDIRGDSFTRLQEEEENSNAKLIAAAPELLDACIKAMSLVDLWAPNYSKEEIKEEHIGELAALSMMRMSLENAINKATK